MPERFQDTTKQFDVIFTTEERIYDAVIESEYNVYTSNSNTASIMSLYNSEFLLM